METVYKSSRVKVLIGWLLLMGMGLILFFLTRFIYSLADNIIGVRFYLLLAVVFMLDLVCVITFFIAIRRFIINDKFYLKLNSTEFIYVKNPSNICSVEWKEIESLALEKIKLQTMVVMRFKFDPEDPDNPTTIYVPISIYEKKPAVIFEEVLKYHGLYGPVSN